MFSGITNLIFGSSSSTEIAEADVRVESSCGLTTIPTEDEWELVDRHSSRTCAICCRARSALVPSQNIPARTSYGDMSSVSRNSSQCQCQPRVEGCYLDHGSDSDTVVSDASSLPEMLAHPSMYESWLMTPPPCFTAGGNSPVRLHTNPLENLLIEHPSMSVYTRVRPSSTGIESDQESVVSDMEVVEEPSTSSGMRKAVVAHTSGRSQVITAKQQLVAQEKAKKAMQSLKKHRDSKKLTKSHLQRSNKVVHANSGRPLRRKHVMQLRNSGAVNDRKSQ